MSAETVEPCGDLVGWPVSGWCPTCRHVVIAHTQDMRCSVCEAVAHLAPQRQLAP